MGSFWSIVSQSQYDTGVKQSEARHSELVHSVEAFKSMQALINSDLRGKITENGTALSVCVVAFVFAGFVLYRHINKRVDTTKQSTMEHIDTTKQLTIEHIDTTKRSIMERVDTDNQSTLALVNNKLDKAEIKDFQNALLNSMDEMSKTIQQSISKSIEQDLAKGQAMMNQDMSNSHALMKQDIQRDISSISNGQQLIKHDILHDMERSQQLTRQDQAAMRREQELIGQKQDELSRQQKELNRQQGFIVGQQERLRIQNEAILDNQAPQRPEQLTIEAPPESRTAETPTTPHLPLVLRGDSGDLDASTHWTEASDDLDLKNPPVEAQSSPPNPLPIDTTSQEAKAAFFEGGVQGAAPSSTAAVASAPVTRTIAVSLPPAKSQAPSSSSVSKSKTEAQTAISPPGDVSESQRGLPRSTRFTQESFASIGPTPANSSPIARRADRGASPSASSAESLPAAQGQATRLSIAPSGATSATKPVVAVSRDEVDTGVKQADQPSGSAVGSSENAPVIKPGSGKSQDGSKTVQSAGAQPAPKSDTASGFASATKPADTITGGTLPRSSRPAIASGMLASRYASAPERSVEAVQGHSETRPRSTAPAYSSASHPVHHGAHTGVGSRHNRDSLPPVKGRAVSEGMSASKWATAPETAGASSQASSGNDLDARGQQKSSDAGTSRPASVTSGVSGHSAPSGRVPHDVPGRSSGTSGMSASRYAPLVDETGPGAKTDSGTDVSAASQPKGTHADPSRSASVTSGSSGPTFQSERVSHRDPGRVPSTSGMGASRYAPRVEQTVGAKGDSGTDVSTGGQPIASDTGNSRPASVSKQSGGTKSNHGEVLSARSVSHSSSKGETSRPASVTASTPAIAGKDADKAITPKDDPKGAVSPADKGSHHSEQPAKTFNRMAGSKWDSASPAPAEQPAKTANRMTGSKWENAPSAATQPSGRGRGRGGAGGQRGNGR